MATKGLLCKEIKNIFCMNNYFLNITSINIYMDSYLDLCVYNNDIHNVLCIVPNVYQFR